MDEEIRTNAEIPWEDEAKRAESAACIAQTIGQLRDMEQYLADLATRLLDGQPDTSH